MHTAERIRVAILFGGLGCVAAGLGVRLVWLQARGVAAASARVKAFREKRLDVPAPRATVLSRDGQILASDRPVFVATGAIELPVEPAARERSRDALVQAFVNAAAEDGDRYDAVALRELQATLYRRFDRRIARALKAREERRLAQSGRTLPSRLQIPFLLIDKELDHPGQLVALRKLDRRHRGVRDWALKLHVKRDYVREYRDRDSTVGVVGLLRDGVGVAGLERLALSLPREPGYSRYDVDAVGVEYWTSLHRPAEEPLGIVTTLDLALQDAADAELAEAVAEVARVKGGPPDWAAMVLVDVASGDLLALSGYLRGKDGEHDPYGLFPPAQCMAEPGSIVKPLHVAMGVNRGAFPWDLVVSCGDRVNYWHKRRITDSHACFDQTPRGVLLNSSNIGAVKLGMRLGAAGLEDYLTTYQFGVRTGLPLPNESPGSRPATALPRASRADREIWTGPSLCFGYEASMTPVQVARAFLTMLAGRQRELRLISRLVVDGESRRVPRRPEGERFLSPATIALVTDALIGVAHGEPGSTARQLANILPEDLPYHLAGKTGTSEVRINQGAAGRKVARVVRTASFAGWAPATAPRYLAVCMVQKTEAASFYGGRYAAPAAGRLLMTAMSRGTTMDERSSSTGQVSVRAGTGSGAPRPR